MQTCPRRPPSLCRTTDDLCLPIVPIAGRLPGGRSGGTVSARRANGGLRLRVTAVGTMGLGWWTKLTYWDYQDIYVTKGYSRHGQVECEMAYTLYWYFS